MNKKKSLLLGILVIFIYGCSSSRMYDKTYRSNMLRQEYPPEITSREDVQKKIESKPVLFERRPQGGWNNHKDAYLVQKVTNIEKINNKEILHVERYVQPDPRSSFDFLSLCKIWFYYDPGDKVVDVEWEYMSD